MPEPQLGMGLGAAIDAGSAPVEYEIEAAPEVPQPDDGRIDWLTRAVEQCGRAFTRLASRVVKVEGRLEQLEARESEPLPAPAPAPPDADSLRRIEALEQRLGELDLLPVRVANLSRFVDELATAQKTAPLTASLYQAPNAELIEMRRQMLALQQRLADVEVRLAPAVEAEVRRHAEHLAAEVPGGPADIQGVYRELDAVAEFVATRAAATAEGLERIGPLEATVLDLRRELRRAVADFTAWHETADVDGRLDTVESRVRRLETSGKRIDHLYSALHESMQGPEVSRLSGTG